MCMRGSLRYTMSGAIAARTDSYSAALWSYMHVQSKCVKMFHVRMRGSLRRALSGVTAARRDSHCAVLWLHMDELCRTHAWVMSHFARVNESCRTYECVMSQAWMRGWMAARNDSYGAAFWSCMYINSKCIKIFYMYIYVLRRHAYMYVHSKYIKISYMYIHSKCIKIWRIHTCHMTRLYVRYDAFICVMWLIHMCELTHSNVQHESSKCATWFIHLYVRHLFFIRLAVYEKSILYEKRIRGGYG